MPLDDVGDVGDFDGHDRHFEQQLSGALLGAVESFAPPAADLVQRATARGRRQARVRTVRIGVTAVALAAFAGTLIGTDPLGGGGSSQAAGLAVPASQSIAPGSPAELADALEGLLPPGGTITLDKDLVMPGSLAVQVTYSEGKGKGTSGLVVWLTRVDPDVPPDQQAYGSCQPIEDRPYDECGVDKLPDGSLLNTTKSFTQPSSDKGQRHWYAARTSADGDQVVVDEYGGGGLKSTASGVTPLLSTSQLSAIATSDVWQKALDSLPASAPNSASPSSLISGPSAAQMRSALEAVLPKTGTLSNWDVSEALARVTYDDGHGKSMVEVNSQENMSAYVSGIMGCAGEPGYCQASTLADGTKVKVTEQAPEKAGTAEVWEVDTLRPDGHRVSAKEANSYADSGPVTRPQPPFTLAQLQTIALSPRWIRQT